MKKIIYIFTLLQSVIGFSQILPLNQSPFERPNGCYIKDLNNDLQPYVGTWETTWDNKKFSITIEKVTQHLYTRPNGDSYYKDFLIGKYLVTNLSNNVVIESTLNISNVNDVTLYSVTSGANSKIIFLYKESAPCYNRAEITLERNSSNSNVLEYSFNQFHSDWLKSPQCTYSKQVDIPVAIPKITMILTKV